MCFATFFFLVFITIKKKKKTPDCYFLVFFVMRCTVCDVFCACMNDQNVSVGFFTSL